MISLVLITILANVSLGVIVLLRSQKKRIPALIFIFSVLISGWTISNYYYDKELSYSLNLLVNRLVFTTTAPLLSTLGHLATIFPSGRKLKKSEAIILYIPSIIFIPLSFTSFIVKDVSSSNGLVTPIFNPTAALFGITALIIIIYVISLFKRNYRNTHSLEKLQMQYFALGLSATSIIAIFTNLVLPMGFDIFLLTNLGPGATLVFVALTIYSIIRYRLFNIRFLIGKAVYYILISIPPYTFFYLIAYLYEYKYGTSIHPTTLITGIPISILFVILFNFLLSFFKNYTDSQLINPGYSPLLELDKLRRNLGSIVDTKLISDETTHLIARTVRTNFQGLIIIPKNKADIWPSYAYKGQTPVDPKKLSLILNYWKKVNNQPLLIDELMLNEDKISYDYLLEEIIKVTKENQIKVVYPLIQDGNIHGMLLLGQKEADSPYTQQDLTFIESIAKTVSLAVGRSILYDEIQEFNKQLQGKVKEATIELKVKNTKLEEALTILEDKRRQERDMVDVMGHELRTPLTIVRNALFMLNQDLSQGKEITNAKLQKYIVIGFEATKREMKLLETLLSATKIEGNRVQLHFTKVDLADIIKDAFDALKYKAKEKELPIEYKAPDSKIYIYADRIRTQEIMDNFLGNAIKYTHEGSVKVKVSSDGKYGKVEVVDSGVGIAPEDLKKLGKKFFRATQLYGDEKNNGNAKYVHPSGTGLGLFVTFELIDIMNGKRDITSEVGKGSNFAFSLPLYTGQEDKDVDQTFMQEKE